MDGYIIQELRAAVLRDLSDFIPEGYYSNVRTDEDLASKDYWLSNRVVSGQYKKPQFMPRQLAASRVLEKIVGYCHEYKSADPVADAADGISPEYIKATQLKLLHDAVTQYVKYLPEHEARAFIFANAPAAKSGAANTNDTASDAPKVSKGKAGRPKTIDTKISAVRDMIAMLERAASIQFTPQTLPGSAADLLEACQRFERSSKIKPFIFTTSLDAFNGWLKSAGYSFPTGRTLDIERNYWTQLVVKVTV